MSKKGLNEENFEFYIKSILYMLSGMLFLGTFFGAINNSLKLITLNVAIGLTIFIIFLWFVLQE